jgi:hypothetical protein
MKVFISSLISNYGRQREAVASSARSVRCEALRAEDFGARPDTLQQACLAAVRSSDVAVLLLGSSYGVVQASGVSATEEKWQEAVREQKPVLVFVEQVEGREPRQQRFVDEVQQWATGPFRASFTSSEELRETVTAELHDFEVAQAAGAADEGEMRRRAEVEHSADDRGIGVGSSGGKHVEGEARLSQNRALARRGEAFDHPDNIEQRPAELSETGQFGSDSLTQFDQRGGGHRVITSQRRAKSSIGTINKPSRSAGTATTSKNIGSWTASHARTRRSSTTRPRPSTRVSVRYANRPRSGGAATGRPSQTAVPNPTVAATG